jgi:hypothetical protein
VTHFSCTDEAPESAGVDFAVWMPPLMLYEQKNGCLVI